MEFVASFFLLLLSLFGILGELPPGPDSNPSFRCGFWDDYSYFWDYSSLSRPLGNPYVVNGTRFITFNICNNLGRFPSIPNECLPNSLACFEEVEEHDGVHFVNVDTLSSRDSLLFDTEMQHIRGFGLTYNGEQGVLQLNFYCGPSEELESKIDVADSPTSITLSLSSLAICRLVEAANTNKDLPQGESWYSSSYYSSSCSDNLFLVLFFFCVIVIVIALFIIVCLFCIARNRKSKNLQYTPVVEMEFTNHGSSQPSNPTMMQYPKQPQQVSVPMYNYAPLNVGGNQMSNMVHPMYYYPPTNHIQVVDPTTEDERIARTLQEQFDKE